MSSVKRLTDMGHPEADCLWYYTPLSEPVLSSELERLSFANSVEDSDVVSFQPSPNPEQYSQDRYVIQDWSLPNGTWTFRAIFDGHGGHNTVDYTNDNLPNIIRDELLAVLSKGASYEPNDISNALAKAISEFDHKIGNALLDLFPNTDALATMPENDILRILDDEEYNQNTIARCECGTTVLISMIDPSKSNVWVASLGDCVAVLGSKTSSNEWMATVLSSSHNGENEIEANRVRSEHPGETECILDNRVLGAIAVTRAIGDFSFKLPAVYTKRVLFNSSRPESLTPEKVRKYIGRNLTPPYLSSTPDVKHQTLSSDAKFLIMCSDGLVDLSEDRLKVQEVLAKSWVNLVGTYYEEKGNLALRLLREAIGGDDEVKVSRMITVEMTYRWMDDTTVIVQRL